MSMGMMRDNTAAFEVILADSSYDGSPPSAMRLRLSTQF